MDATILLERAQLLLDQGRHRDARTNVTQALERDPQNDYALSLLGRCFYANKQYEEGISVIREAIALEPLESFYFYLLAFGEYQMGRAAPAQDNLKRALQLNPYHSEYYGLLAYVLLYIRAFEQALEKANEGLAIDGDNITCLNARSVALNKLKRTDDALQTMQTALAQDPDNEMTHATVGWNLLEKGQHREASKHFLEALRLEPNYETARSGLKESLKSKIPPYKWLLQYSFWVQNKGKRLGTILPIALYILFRILIGLSAGANQTSLAWALGGVYLLLVVTTWTINSIANFFLLFDEAGKYALTTSEKWTAITVVATLITGLALLATAVFTSLFTGTIYEVGSVMAGIVCVSLALPLSSIRYPFSLREIKGWREWYTVLLVTTGVASLLLFIVMPQVAMMFFIVYGIAFIAYNWLGVGR